MERTEEIITKARKSGFCIVWTKGKTFECRLDAIGRPIFKNGTGQRIKRVHLEKALSN